MSSRYALYNRLYDTLSPLITVSNRKQLTNWLGIVVGLLLGQSPALSHIATYLPMATAAESRVTVIRRWLQNQHVDGWSMYAPILQHVLRDWSTATA